MDYSNSIPQADLFEAWESQNTKEAFADLLDSYFQPAQSSPVRVSKKELFRSLLKNNAKHCLTCSIIRTGKNQFVKMRRGCN